MGITDTKTGVRADWLDDERAVAWSKWHAQWQVQSRAATEAMVRAVAPRPGMHVLDLACGTGEPAITLARAVMPGGRVTAADLAPGMLESARENAARAGVANITFQQADAEALPFTDGSFDAVTCRFGIMFVPNVGRAFEQVRRVLRPGGRAAFMGWGPREDNPVFLTTTGVLKRHVDMPDPQPDAPDGYRFAKKGSFSAALRQAGFSLVEEQHFTVPWPWPGEVEEAWLSFVEMRGAPFRRNLDKVPAERLPLVMNEIYAAIGQYFDGKQVNFTAALVLASAVRE